MAGNLLRGNATTVCLIPARSGSKRVKDKNIIEIKGHPLLAYTISAALASAEFCAVIVSTDDERYADIARHYGAAVNGLRPSELAGDESPDIDWIELEIRRLQASGNYFNQFALLRPTNPFRSKATIARALEHFRRNPWADSLRAVERTAQHPGKMWTQRGGQLFPVLPVQSGETDWFSSPTQVLPEVWVQNASLEISLVTNVINDRNITGDRILGFETRDLEGFDVNTQQDVILLQHYIASFPEALPVIDAPRYSAE